MPDLTVADLQRGDNLRPVSVEARPIARAALRFLESIERGTVWTPTVIMPGGDAIVQEVEAGKYRRRCVYRSLAGDAWNAEIVAARRIGGQELFDLDVVVPGCEDRVRLTGVRRTGDRRGGSNG